MSTFTVNTSIEKPAHGADANTWDVPVNADWDIIDACFGNTTTINATSASGTVALTVTQYRPRMIFITGTLTAAVNYQFPAGVGWFGTIFNNTAGAYAITISSADGGATLNVAQGVTTPTICVSGGTGVGLFSTAPGSAGGSNSQVQYNSSGALAGSANLVFTGTNLGIGVASPGAPLSVGGSLRIYGASSGYVGFSAAAAAGSTVYSLPAADGSSGQVLTTNGSAALSWTTVSGGGGGVTSFSGGSTGLTPVSPGTGAVSLGGILSTSYGGLGITTTPSSGAIPIGTGSGYQVATLTQGSGISITNGAGSITISATGAAGGTVTSVAAGTGLSGGTITTSGTISLNLNSGNTWTARQTFGAALTTYPNMVTENTNGSADGYVQFGSGISHYLGYDASKYIFGGTNTTAYDLYCPNDVFAYHFTPYSDYRLKTDVRPLSGVATERLARLKPVIYTLGERDNVEGFLAHELAEIIPGAVFGEKDAVNDNGTPKYQAVDYAQIVPVLVAAIQELTQRIERLEAA